MAWCAKVKNGKMCKTQLIRVLLLEGGQLSSLGCKMRKFLVFTSRVGAQGLSPARAELR